MLIRVFSFQSYELNEFFVIFFLQLLGLGNNRLKCIQVEFVFSLLLCFDVFIESLFRGKYGLFYVLVINIKEGYVLYQCMILIFVFLVQENLMIILEQEIIIYGEEII